MSLYDSIAGWFGGGGQTPQASYPGIPQGTQQISQFTLPAVAGDPNRIGARVMDGSTLFNGQAVPAAPGGAATPFGMNVGTGQLALSGLGAIGNAYSAWNASNLAKKQFDFTSGLARTNLANQVKSYNTALSDKARSRGAAEGQSQAQVDQYVASNRMSQ